MVEQQPDERGRDFMDFITSPAEDDPKDEMDAWVRFLVCPECAAGYPEFYSPTGVLGTFCGAAFKNGNGCRCECFRGRPAAALSGSQEEVPGE